MTNHHRFDPPRPTPWRIHPLWALALAGVLLAAVVSPAQDKPVPSSSDTERTGQVSGHSGEAAVTVPSGTKIFLALVRPISTKTAKAGDGVYLQTIFPVLFNGKMLIPAGTYLEGKLDKIFRPKDHKDTLEVDLQSADLILANGYVVPLVAGVQTPTSGSTATGLALMVAWRANDVLMDVGTQADMTLPASVVLDADKLAGAIRKQAPVRAAIRPPRPQAICYTAGSPGTPDTIIPGTPPTPPTVIPGGPGMPDTIIPGTPGTPDTVIPGTPPTPGTSYPCPK